EDGIRDFHVTGVQTCALPIWRRSLTVQEEWRERSEVEESASLVPHRPARGRVFGCRILGGDDIVPGHAYPAQRRGVDRERLCRKIGRAACRDGGEIDWSAGSS